MMPVLLVSPGYQQLWYRLYNRWHVHVFLQDKLQPLACDQCWGMVKEWKKNILAFHPNYLELKELTPLAFLLITDVHYQMTSDLYPFDLQGELDTQVHTLRQKVTDLELQLAEVKRSEIQAREERDLERLRSTLSPHRSRPSSAPGAREAQGRAASMPGRGTPRHTPEREVCDHVEDHQRDWCPESHR